jgi:Protein of unknown function (DUF2934)
MTADGAGLILQLTELADRVGQVDGREAEHWAQAREQLADLATKVTAMRGDITDQAAILASLDGLDETVAELAAQISALAPAIEMDNGYRLRAPVKWWSISPEEKAEAVAHLRAWVQDVYVPGFGRMAEALPECWSRHPFCLLTVEYLSELWCLFQLREPRTTSSLANLAELVTRILPTAVAQMAAECKGCDHPSGRIPVNGNRTGGLR